MRIKKVNRYWCDFCNKAGLSAHAMRKHEQHCTLNPLRKCRVCQFINGGNGCCIEELKSLLPDATEFHESHAFVGDDNAYSRLLEATEATMPSLREATDNCPACIMAALRQAKIPVPMVDSFDFKAEMQKIFNDSNQSREGIGGYC
jgi:hypothetical protein